MIKKKEKSKIEVLSVKYFFDMFQLEKRRYPPSLFCLGEKTRKKKPQPVPLSLYKKIILEYFKVYFYDFYMNESPIYFFLGGFLKKVIYKKWARKMAKGKAEKKFSRSDGAIGLYWYMRASQKMFYMVKIKKLTGSSNRLPEIENLYKDNFNKDLLPIFSSEFKRGKLNKTLYICTPI